MNVDDFIQKDLSRRQFLGRSAQNAAGVAAGMVGLSGAAVLAKAAAAERVQIAVIGVRNQGKSLAAGLAALPEAQIVTLCDVDENVLVAASHAVQKEQGTTPHLERDFRRLLDDPKVDAVVIATPDHWHTPMTLAACEAGKDVYVETPVTHFGGEGASLVEAARRHQRIVTAGLPHRSAAHFQSAMRVVQSGQLGAVPLVKAWFVQKRQPLAASAVTEPPADVDYSAWLGPAPQRPFESHRFHFHWRWFWDYGAGDLGVWGSQFLDAARWGLGLTWPQRVCSSVGQRVLRDATETPDSLQVQFDCGDRTVIWEHRSWSNHAPEGRTSGVAFHGERGTLILDRGGWKIYGCQEPQFADGSEFVRPHLADFIHSIKTRQRPAADIAEASTSAGWCHLANLSHRVHHELTIDVQTGTPLDDSAQALWTPSRDKSSRIRTPLPDANSLA